MKLFYIRSQNEITALKDDSKDTNFKEIVHETTVYKYYIELKEDVFTKKGFLDLAKVPELRITGAGRFLRKLRTENILSQMDVAKILWVSREVVKEWERNVIKMPLEALVKISETLNVSRDSIYSIIKQGKFSLKRAILPLEFEQIRDIVLYLSPSKDGITLILRKSCPENLIDAILSLNINLRTYGHKKVIYSKELNHYITTFFRFTKIPKIHPPLTTEVKGWFNDGIDLKRAIIIPCLQTDGSIDNHNPNKSKALLFTGNNKILHNLFVDAIYLQYNSLPSSCFKRFNDHFVTCYTKRSINEIADELMNIAGSTKTSPAQGQSVDIYLKEPQPKLDYLINASEIEQKIALRIWASTEGSFSIYRDRLRIYPRLEIGCTHPVLAKQLQDIGKQHNMRLKIRKYKKTWSGVAYLHDRTLSGCINFLKLGGFIKGVKVSRNSPYYEGIDKNILTLGVFEYIRQERMNKKPQILPMYFHHNNVKRIIKNREYKSAGYYIDYFSKEH